MKEIKHFTRMFTQIFTSFGILLIAFETNICYIPHQLFAFAYGSGSFFIDWYLFTGLILVS